MMPSVQEHIRTDAPANLLCFRCGTPMRLTLVMPMGPEKETRTFDCDACGKAETITVKCKSAIIGSRSNTDVMAP